MRKKFLKNTASVVIKVGTSVLSKNKKFDRAMIQSLADQISSLLKKKIKVSIVSSGAIGSGMTILKMKNRPQSIPALQGAAAVGQRYLMQCYEEAFSKKGFSTAQMLLTWQDLADEKRRLNAKHTLSEIQKWGVIPIINENDTVATDEIRFGDNDQLSSLLAILVEADLLVILSDTDGLYANGKHNQARHRLSMVEKMDESIFSHVRDGKNSLTVGGMSSKLKAIQLSVNAGIPVFLADGREKNVIEKIFNANDIGTFFAPRQVKTKKNWATFLVKNIKEGRRRNDQDRRKADRRAQDVAAKNATQKAPNQLGGKYA